MRALVQATLLLLTAFFIHAAYAQYGGGFPGGGGMRGGMRGGMGGARGPDRGGERPVAPQRRLADPEALEDQLGLMEEALNLTQAQWPAWQRYADRVRALAADVAREQARTESTEKQNAVQQIDHATDTVRNRLAALEEIGTAARALYGTLTPQQQGIADASLANAVLQLTGAPRAGYSSRPSIRN